MDPDAHDLTPIAMCFIAIPWERANDGEYPYRAIFNHAHCMIRVNDFPAEPLYTLLIDGKAVLDLEDWPAAWTKPAS